MELRDVLCSRHSARAYSERQITDEQLNYIIEAAMLSPVGMKRYDLMELRVVQDRNILNALNADFAASIGNAGAKPTYDAPTVIFVIGKNDSASQVIAENAACIVEQMTLAATDLGLGSVYLHGICATLRNSAQASALLKIDCNHYLVAGAAIGYELFKPEMRQPDMNKMKLVKI